MPPFFRHTFLVMLRVRDYRERGGWQEPLRILMLSQQHQGALAA